jgi:hypothetical protein
MIGSGQALVNWLGTSAGCCQQQKLRHLHKLVHARLQHCVTCPRVYHMRSFLANKVCSQLYVFLYVWVGNTVQCWCWSHMLRLLSSLASVGQYQAASCGRRMPASALTGVLVQNERCAIRRVVCIGHTAPACIRGTGTLD